MHATTPPPPVLLERQGAIATLRFNRPEVLNAIDVPMAQAFLVAVQTIAADPGVRAVVLTGNERLAQVSQIRKFHLLTKELDHDDGEVTATMKVRRSSIYETYAAEIEALDR